MQFSDFEILTTEERCMRVPHKCTLGCQVLPSDHWPRAEFFEEHPENLKQLRKTITLHDYRKDPTLVTRMVEEFLQGQSTGVMKITLEKSISAQTISPKYFT